MATTTPNYGWPVPTSTDLVKDGATAIEALGDAVDATVFSLGVSGAWTSYTPTFRTGVDTKTATISYAKYKQLGKTLVVQVRLTATQAGTASQKVNISLPAGFTYQNDNANSVQGSFLILDAGTAFYVGVANIQSGYIYGISYNTVDYMGASGPTMTIANNDVIGFNIIVEVA
jgi:hypothetical protein